MKEYTLEVAEIPVRSRLGIYDHIVAEYAKTVLNNPDAPLKTVKVTIPDRQLKTVGIGLAKAIKTAGYKDKIAVSLRMDDVWLLPRK